MEKLAGKKPHQFPTNGDLGSMAYQDHKAVNIAGGKATLQTATVTDFSANKQSLSAGDAIASASTVNLNNATGSRVHITGTTTIAAITLSKGPVTVIFDGVLTLTHHATNNNLPGAANIVTAAGDRAVYESDGTTVYCTSYTKADGSSVVAPGEKRFIATGTIPTGAYVGLRSDGTVEVISLATPTTGTPVTTNKTGSYAYSPTDNKILLVYADDTDGYKGKACVGTVSGNSISFGTVATFETGNTSAICSVVHYPTTNKFVIAFKGGGANGSARVATISGTTVSFGTAAVFESSAVIRGKVIYCDAEDRVVVVFGAGSPYYGKAVVGTVSGTTISFGSTNTFSSSSFLSDVITACYCKAEGKIVIAFADSANSHYGTCVVSTIASNLTLFGSSFVFSSSYTGGGLSAVYDESQSRVLLSFRDHGNSGHGKAIVGKVSGYSITFGSAATFLSASLETLVDLYVPEIEKVVITFSDGGSSYHGKILFATVVDMEVEFSFATTFSSAPNSVYGSVFNEQSKNFVTGCLSSSTFTHFVFDPFTSNADSAIGVSQKSVTNGQSVPVKILGGIDANQSGLVPGTRYNMSIDGKLTTSETVYGQFGRAMSATELLVTAT